MAIFTSGKGYFEVSSLSFAPDIITFGEETAFKISIKNVSGKKISSMYMRGMLYYRSVDGEVRPSSNVFLFGGPSFDMKSISWANGVTKTFEGKISFSAPASYPPDMSTRLLPLFTLRDIVSSGDDTRLGFRLLIVADSIFADGTNTDNIYDLRGADSEYLYVIDKRYRPSILAFSAERSDGVSFHDEGENVLAGMRLALGDNTHRDRLSLQFRYRDNAVGGAYTSIDISTLMQHALSGSITTLIQIAPNENLVLDKNSDWDLVLWYGDQFESAVYPTRDAFILPRSFANMHLSGKKNGGVCFGSFSKATDENPLFQCYYPAEFEEGIKGGFTYESGEVRTGGKWIDGKEIYRYVMVAQSALDGGAGVIGQMPSAIENLISTSGTMKGTDGSVRPIPYAYYGNNTFTVCYYIDASGAINFQIGSGYSGTNTIILVLEYTKP